MASGSTTVGVSLATLPDSPIERSRRPEELQTQYGASGPTGTRLRRLARSQSWQASSEMQCVPSTRCSIGAALTCCSRYGSPRTHDLKKPIGDTSVSSNLFSFHYCPILPTAAQSFCPSIVQFEPWPRLHLVPPTIEHHQFHPSQVQRCR